MRQLAPIALFTYNRPDHTLRTLQALKANTLSAESVLYIFADGLKEGAAEKQKMQVAAVREVIRQEQWCGKVIIREAAQNRGLAKSITEGINEVISQNGKIIVLEDDIVTSSGFLTYMNDALQLYEKNEKVMHISGFLPDIETTGLPETFFLRFMSCWGWATWQHAWEKYQPDSLALLERLVKERRLEEFNLGGAIKFHNYLKGNLTGRHNSWAVKWFATIFFEEGLCLYPRTSVVQNIGFDGSGAHYNTRQEKPHPMLVKHLWQEVNLNPEIPLEVNVKARKALAHFYKYENNFSMLNLIRANYRYIKQRILIIKEYIQSKKLKQYADSARVHA